MQAIQTLKEEHENIRRLLRVIRSAQLKVLEGTEPSAEDFRQFVAFIRLYADQTHHGKEEEFLFAEMLKELGRSGENLIRHGMLVEHDLARLYVQNLETAVQAFQKEQSADAKLDMLIYSGAYADLLERHIAKENAVVFTFADNQLSEAAKAAVERDMEAFETDAAHAEVREEQLARLAALEEKYL